MEQFPNGRDKGGNLAVSQDQIDEALEEAYRELDYLTSLNLEPKEMSTLIVKKAIDWILGNTAENCRKDVAAELAGDMFQAMREQALNRISKRLVS
jgi:hypothetical protein